MAYVYQVKGSEDGTIAICGSRQRAIKKAIEYVEQQDSKYIRSENSLGDVSLYGCNLSAYVEKWLLE